MILSPDVVFGEIARTHESGRVDDRVSARMSQGGQYPKRTKSAIGKVNRNPLLGMGEKKFGTVCWNQ